MGKRELDSISHCVHKGDDVLVWALKGINRYSGIICQHSSV